MALQKPTFKHLKAKVEDIEEKIKKRSRVNKERITQGY